jgi:hypothetical protein
MKNLLFNIQICATRLPNTSFRLEMDLDKTTPRLRGRTTYSPAIVQPEEVATTLINQVISSLSYLGFLHFRTLVIL